MNKKTWLTIALVNLSVVALLGVTLRAKIMFSIPGLDFKNILHAHSHFAFGGWVTLGILSLMTYELLPAAFSSRPVYKWLLGGILVNAAGMLISFPIWGYAFWSILFSTLFIFVTYAYTWVFIRDLLKSDPPASVKLLAIVALAALVLSSAGPFTLAYIIASHSVNTMLYRDSIYTYLHFQYNGFFTIGIFALFFNMIGRNISEMARKARYTFSVALSVCIFPTLCLSYLWHFDNVVVRSIAISGCILLVVVFILFFGMMKAVYSFVKTIPPFAKLVGLLSMIAFALKTLIQIGIVFPTIGNAVFGDRPIIIGYLHLVLLGFVSLYLLAHIFQSGYFNGNRAARTGIVIFAIGVIFNELVLMTQGLGAMLMLSSTLYPLLLLIAALALFSGAAILAISSVQNFGKQIQ